MNDLLVLFFQFRDPMHAITLLVQVADVRLENRADLSLLEAYLKSTPNAFSLYCLGCCP